ncbi:hypothetical protein N9F64_00335 [bacterium]|nr:hypothetical protein [bacterium]|tara:strand:- start:195 stop:1055 length:861 start_codon:yes stop_codon:yes gene_type:complete
MDKLKEVLKPKDVKPSLLKRLEANYGPVDMTNDFFSTDLDTYFKTTNINKETGQLSHDIIQLASFGDSLKRMSDAVKALKILQTTDEANNDQNIKEITRELKDVFNKYRSHLRTNYPDQYDEIKRQLDEMSTTGGGAGAASFTGGTGMQYATPYAFKKKKKKVDEGIGADLGPGPKASEDGVKDNAYVKQFKYKLVPKDKNGNYVQKGSGLEVKQLFEAESASEFQKKRITAFDQIEQELNNIYKMLSNAKNETVEYYNDNESSYSVVKPTDLVLDYIKDIKDLLK